MGRGDPLIFIVSGETSGDNLAGRLMAALKRKTGGRVRFAGVGGPQSEAEGLQSLYPMSDLSLIGLAEVLPHLPRLVRRLCGQEQPKWIEVDELASLLKEGPGIALIDVRGADEFTGTLGHIADAANLPVGELPKRLAEINALKDRPVILVCRTDKRSATAAALLRDAGFRDVGVLRGGMERWNQNGLPVDRHTDLEHTGMTVAPVVAALMREPE